MQINEWLDTDLGKDIWNKKYKFNNEDFDGFLDRVSNRNAEVRQLIIEKKFLFGGRTLTNYNTNKKGASTSNCYSSGYAPDDLEGLLELNKNIGLTYKAQGGQGISLSNIRPKGSPLSDGYTTDGIVSFMKIFNTTTASVSQGGSRKGALMLSLDIWHKEALTFITIKSTTGEIEKANLSLEIDDEFMGYIDEYYKTGIEQTVQKVFNYETGYIEYEVIPILLYKEFCKTAYDWAEPGCIFTDEFRNYNLMEFIEEYMVITGNPCGEQPLPKDGACNLGSNNLSNFVLNPYTSKASFDYTDFKRAVNISIKALDEVIDYGYQYHALQSQKDMAFNYRNIGLGIMGLGSLFFKMNLTYGDAKSISLIDEIMNLMFRESVRTSNEMAKEKGTFPKYDKRVFKSNIILNHFTKEEIKLLSVDGLRNCSLLSVAPSGSIATMLNITTGVEPAFRISYQRKTESLHKDAEVFYDVCIKEADEYKKINAIDTLPEWFIGSDKVNYVDRIEMQSITQFHVDTAISSTVNLPNEATQEDVEKLYLLAWKKHLKGITIYRDGCKRGAILTSGKVEPAIDEVKLEWGTTIGASDDLIGKKRKIMSGCGSLHVQAWFDPINGRMMETFLTKGSTGGCNSFMIALSRMLSVALRTGADFDYVIEQLKSTPTCSSYSVRSATKKDTSKGNCCPTAIANAFVSMQEEINYELDIIPETIEEVPKIKKIKKPVAGITKPKCPTCGGELRFEGGCNQCVDCGYSKCD